LVQAGEFVSRGLPVARLVDTENREIRAQAPLTVSAYVREGLEVSVEHQDQQSLSPITRVIPVGDERSRMFEVRIASDDPAWVIGSPVRVALPNSDPRELVAIHRDALVLRGSEMFVLRVADDNTVEKVNVHTGIGLGDLVEVIGNVSGGDRVVTRGAERLKAGQRVVIAGGS
jgi:multidrug efflux pump subunit AcrA (membrane-fusion protein)